MWVSEINQDVLENFRKRRSEGFKDTCWLWNGSKNKGGYGIFSMPSGKLVLAHRLCFFIETGIDPAGKVISHGCDNPSCVNPHHLSLTTQKQNMLDASAAKRWPKKYKVKFPHKKIVDDLRREESATLRKMEGKREL